MASSSARRARSGPLAGIRVLDLTSVIFGPYCTQILSDLGAEVIKLEAPEGDSSRNIGPKRIPGLGGTFLNLNRGKQSVVCDLGTVDGREFCLRLVEQCDVLVHSIRPQAIARLGLDYADVVERRPDVVYCNLLGYAREGRYAGRPAFDDIIQGASGLAALQARLSGRPSYMATVLADKVGSLNAAYSVMAALFHRERTGEGQEVDVSMFEAAVAFMLVEHIGGSAFDPPRGEPVYNRVVAVDRRPVRTQTGWLAVMVYTNDQWRRFCTAIDRHDWIVDPRFVTLDRRVEHADVVNTLLHELFMTRTAEDWLELLHRIDVPVAPINEPADLFDDPHLADIGFFKTVIDDTGQPCRFTDIPVKFSRTPGGFDQPGPALGRHTEHWLRRCGYDDQAIADLVQRKVVGLAPSLS